MFLLLNPLLLSGNQIDQGSGKGEGFQQVKNQFQFPLLAGEQHTPAAFKHQESVDLGVIPIPNIDLLP